MAKIYTEIHKFRSSYGNWMQISLLGWPVMVSSIWFTVFNEAGQETEQKEKLQPVSQMVQVKTV